MGKPFTYALAHGAMMTFYKVINYTNLAHILSAPDGITHILPLRVAIH